MADAWYRGAVKMLADSAAKAARPTPTILTI